MSMCPFENIVQQEEDMFCKTLEVCMHEQQLQKFRATYEANPIRTPSIQANACLLKLRAMSFQNQLLDEKMSHNTCRGIWKMLDDMEREPCADSHTLQMARDVFNYVLHSYAFDREACKAKLQALIDMCSTEIEMNALAQKK